MSVNSFKSGVINIKNSDILHLHNSAKRSQLKRARLCLHNTHDDLVQEMIIAFCKGSYIRPHRHINKTESFHVIEGELIVVIFDEYGRVSRKIRMGQYTSEYNFIYRLASPLWHTLIPLTELVIIHETTTGPFIKGDSDFADWAPLYDEPEKIRDYLSSLIDEL